MDIGKYFSSLKKRDLSDNSKEATWFRLVASYRKS